MFVFVVCFCCLLLFFVVYQKQTKIMKSMPCCLWPARSNEKPPPLPWQSWRFRDFQKQDRFFDPNKSGPCIPLPTPTPNDQFQLLSVDRGSLSGFPDQSESRKTMKSPDPRIGPIRGNKIHFSSKYIQYAKIAQIIAFCFWGFAKHIGKKKKQEESQGLPFSIIKHYNDYN